MKERAESEFIWDFKELHENLLTRVLNPALMILYNKEYHEF